MLKISKCCRFFTKPVAKSEASDERFIFTYQRLDCPICLEIIRSKSNIAGGIFPHPSHFDLLMYCKLLRKVF